MIYASSAPSPELTSLRGKLVLSKGSVKAGKNPTNFALPAANNGICEILLDIDAVAGEDVKISLSNKAGNKVDMVYDASKHTLSFDRRESGIVDFSENFPAVTVSPTFETAGKISLRIFVDKSSIEVFGNGGQFVMTNLVFPVEPYSNLSVSSNGGKSKISSLKIYSLKN